MSQVPVGFTRRLHHMISVGRPDLNFELYYWVETLVIGNAVKRFLNPERIIIGSSTNAAAEGTSLGRLLSAFSCPVVTMSYESAELTKASINLYLSVSVTFANVLADLCEATGASMKEITPALRMDRRIGQYSYIQPGLGIAGGNLERDLVNLQQLAQKSNVDARLINTVVDLNKQRYKWVHKQLNKHVFAHTIRPDIAVWGLAYKKDTQSVKNSFAVRILEDLAGKAGLCAYDPLAQLPNELEKSVVTAGRLDVLNNADCLLVLTAWDEFANTDYAWVAKAMRGGLIIDCVDVLDRAKAMREGLEYVSIGESHE